PSGALNTRKRSPPLKKPQSPCRSASPRPRAVGPREPGRDRRLLETLGVRAGRKPGRRAGRRPGSRHQEGGKMMTTMTSNGRPARKTLASQIDRLDTMLSGLAESIDETVADAVRAAVVVAVREAVQAVLTEVLSNPEVLARLRDTLPPSIPPVAKPALGPRVKERLARAWSWLAAKVRGAVAACLESLHRLGEGAAKVKERVQQAGQAVWLRLRLLRHFRGQLLLAVGVGVAAGVAAFLAAPWLAAVLSGLGGFMTAVAVQGGVLLLPLAAAGGQPRRSRRSRAPQRAGPPPP